MKEGDCKNLMKNKKSLKAIAIFKILALIVAMAYSTLACFSLKKLVFNKNIFDFSQTIITKSVHLDSQQEKRVITSREIAKEYTFNVKDAIFVNCRSFSPKLGESEGGALVCAGVVGIIDSCIFVNNSVYQNAGAIKISSSPKTELTNCLFSENKANEFGGAVVCYLIFDFNAENTNFSSNKCTKEVGAIALSLCDTSTFTDCYFYENEAKYFGSFFTEVSEVFLFAAVFSNNKSPEDNRTNSLYFSEKSVVKITKSFFISEIYRSIFVDKTSKLSIDESSFSGVFPQEIINESSNFNIENCDFSAKIDFAAPTKALINISIPPTGHTIARKKQAHELEKETIPIDLIYELNRKEIDKKEEKSGINDGELSVIMFILFVLVLIIIYLITYVCIRSKTKKRESSEKEKLIKDSDESKKEKHEHKKRHTRKSV